MSNNNILNLKMELLHFLENEFPKSEISTDDSGFLYLENEKLDIVFLFKKGELNVYDNKARGSKHNMYNGSLKKFKQMVVKNKFGWKENKQLKVDKKLISKIAKWIYNEGIENSTYGNWITGFDEIADEFNITYYEAISMSDLIYAEVYKYKGVCDIEMYEEDDDVLVIDVNYFIDYLESYCGDDD